MVRASFFAVFIAAAIYAVACANPERLTRSDPESVPGSLVIKPERDSTATNATLQLGEKAWLRVVGIDSMTAVHWSVSDSSVVGIAAQRYSRVSLLGLRLGQATLIATRGADTGKFEVLVHGGDPVNNIPPTATIRRGVSLAQEGTIIGIDATGSSDPDGDSLTYEWDFGDGWKGIGFQTEHRYIDNGKFTVTLTVTDPYGAADNDVTSIEITNSTPVIVDATLRVPRLPAPVPMTASIHLEVSDLGAADHPVATVDWGDGTVSRDTVHTYPQPGVYTAKVTVTDKDGAASKPFTALNAARVPAVVWAYDSIDPQPTLPGYDVVGLGTLGGDRSLPLSLNNLGEIVGASATADTQEHAFLWKDGTMRDIGPPQLTGQRKYGVANKITDAGWILGWEGIPASSVAIWRNGVFDRSVPLLLGSEGGRAVAVDEAGDILLNMYGHEYHHSALLRNGNRIDLVGFMATAYAWAFDMNKRGQVVGSSPYRAGSSSLGYATHAFLWENGLMKELGDLDPPCPSDPNKTCGASWAYDINDAGQIVGWASQSNTWVAAMWEPGAVVPRDIGFGPRTSAVAINERGQIVGLDNEHAEAFFGDGGVVVRLGSLGGGRTHVAARNEQGAVVGWSTTASGEVHAFVWRRETGMVDLGPGPYGANKLGTVAVGINDHGDVVGYVVPCLDPNNGFCSDVSHAQGILWRNKN